MLKQPDTLVLEGGALRCAFTAGILDVFMAHKFMPFKRLIGVSSGAMAMSFYASGQSRHFIQISRAMVEDPDFISYSGVWSEDGMMNLRHLQRYTDSHYPLNEEAVRNRLHDADIQIVVASKETGEARYLTPSPGAWRQQLLASATLPFITQGRVEIDGHWMFDGGYADPIPVERALACGSKDVLVIRTRPAAERVDQSYIDWFGTWWYRDNPALRRLFANWHKNYNRIADMLAAPAPPGLHWTQLAPPQALASDGYAPKHADVDLDYRLGLEIGMEYLRELDLF